MDQKCHDDVANGRTHEYRSPVFLHETRESTAGWLWEMYKTKATTYNLSNDDARKLENAFVRKQSHPNQDFYKSAQFRIIAMSYHFKYWQMHEHECHRIRSELQRMESESHQQDLESHRNEFNIHRGRIGPQWGRFEYHRGLLVSLGEDAKAKMPLSKADEVLLKSLTDRYEDFEDYETDLLHKRPAQSSIFLDRMITSKFFVHPPRLVEEGCREIKAARIPSKISDAFAIRAILYHANEIEDMYGEETHVLAPKIRWLNAHIGLPYHGHSSHLPVVQQKEDEKEKEVEKMIILEYKKMYDDGKVVGNIQDFINTFQHNSAIHHELKHHPHRLFTALVLFHARKIQNGAEEPEQDLIRIWQYINEMLKRI